MLPRIRLIYKVRLAVHAGMADIDAVREEDGGSAAEHHDGQLHVLITSYFLLLCHARTILLGCPLMCLNGGGSALVLQVGRKSARNS